MGSEEKEGGGLKSSEEESLLTWLVKLFNVVWERVWLNGLKRCR